MGGLLYLVDLLTSGDGIFMEGEVELRSGVSLWDLPAEDGRSLAREEPKVNSDDDGGWERIGLEEGIMIGATSVKCSQNLQDRKQGRRMLTHNFIPPSLNTYLHF